jgi:monoamine oxidase
MEHRETDVCIVGAGFAGIAAARWLTMIGKKSVVVLEARDRVGGRVWDKTTEDGSVVSVGGTWLGDGQVRMRQLVAEAGLGLYPQYIGDPFPGDDPDIPLDPLSGLAENVLQFGGVNHHYKGMAAPIGLEALACLGLAMEQLTEIAKSVPIDAPWTAPDAETLDAQTLGAWIASERNLPIRNSRIMLKLSMSLLFSCDPSEVSLLGSMLLAHGGGDRGLTYYSDASITETDLIDGGGAPEVARILAGRLGDALRTSAPVRRIEHGPDHVDVVADGITVRAKYVIITAPPILASQIEYVPPLPDAHGQLMRKMPPGAITRFIAVYDKPFWRDKGLSGESAAPQSPVIVSIDQSPKPSGDGSQQKGVLSSYAVGAKAMELSRMNPIARKELVLGELASRLGDEAKNPIGYTEADWSAEQWSQGGMIGHPTTGVLTSYGSALHEPAGRIYWAGTERAKAMHGLMEGAVRSGEETAEAVNKQLGG